MNAEMSGKVLSEFQKRIGTNFKQGEKVCAEIATDLGLDPEEVTNFVYATWYQGYNLDVKEEEKIEEEEEI